MLASIHLGKEPDRHEKRLYAVGWRQGIYSILPTLLHTLDPTLASIGLACNDSFLANLRAREHGMICSTVNSFVYQDELDLGLPITTDEIIPISFSDPRTGPALRSSPDCPLYLSLERPMHYGGFDLHLVGRVNGSVVGTTCIRNVMKTILLSGERLATSRHMQTSHVQNVKASR